MPDTLIHWHAALLVWAQTNPALDMGRRFREAEQNFRWSQVLLVVGVIITIALTTWLLVRLANHREKRTFHHPGSLFSALCRAHGFPRQTRWLLRRLAKAHRLTHPGLLFVQPERFDVAQLGPHWQKERSRLESLRDAIFGRRLEEVDASPA